MMHHCYSDLNLRESKHWKEKEKDMDQDECMLNGVSLEFFDVNIYVHLKLSCMSNHLLKFVYN